MMDANSMLAERLLYLLADAILYPFAWMFLALVTFALLLCGGLFAYARYRGWGNKDITPDIILLRMSSEAHGVRFDRNIDVDEVQRELDYVHKTYLKLVENK